ncbi:InlB B-repeat-containing protein [Candidatus Magnetominusculus xianensis]|uniref:Bacterial repeat domain-containing protein n=1 Tax=Candidatus Magnetominusculus xianensis TaxID=1748249 RepID=A0ABR5SIN0_9BACT|nr:hypothetical protein [Candidatus Magnetominusculus xianensis]KWT84107.1 hypothetical protein ASN18_2035 [Candidatus Magnetominusculus xianensis]MBF0402401.1 hypothetical protein [Nitrospirota bacterium]
MVSWQNIIRAIREQKGDFSSSVVFKALMRCLAALIILSAAGYSFGATTYTCGYTWTEQTNSGQRYWWKVASSDDGVHLAAIEYNGYIYTSSDNGTTWTQTNSGQRPWYAIASSSSGQRLAAVENSPNGYVYISWNYGDNWTRTSAMSTNWMTIASSTSGNILYAGDYTGHTYIYKSMDGGLTWQARSTIQDSSTPTYNNPGIGYFYTIATSDDGQAVALGPSNGDIYTSSDNATSWKDQVNSGQKFWWSIASSWDGKRLSAVEGYGGYIYTSADSGSSWTTRTGAGSQNWTSISSGPLGVVLAASSFGNDGYIYTSQNSGDNWTQETSAGSRLWTSVSVSYGGDKIAATTFGGYIYTAARPQYNVLIQLQGTGTGTVLSTSGPILWDNTGTNGMAIYTCPQYVTLIAEPTIGDSFSGWTGCDSTSGAQCTVVMTSLKNITAVFGVPQTDRTLTVINSGNGGTVTSSPSGITCGTGGSSCKTTFADNLTVTLTATANASYAFKSWSGCDSTNGTQCTVIMSANKTVSVSFDSIPTSLVINKIGNGTVVSSPSGIYCGSLCSAQYADNTTVILTATGDPGYGFLSWTGCTSSIDEQCTMLMSSDNKTATAQFATSDTIITTNASNAINGIYNKMSSFFGTPLGTMQSGTNSSGTIYVQWYTSGTAILAWSDGTMWYYYNQAWHDTGLTWKQDITTNLQKATAAIDKLYDQYPLRYGTKTTEITAYRDSLGNAYYVQWYANSGLLAWSDGIMYYYTNGRWDYTGISWK